MRNVRDDLQLRRRVAEEAARAGGAVHRRNRGSHLERTVHAGERSDYTTQVDIEAQRAVRDVVARYFPHERVIGEEDESWEGIEALIEAGCWFTDPLDGTSEYAHNLPGYSCVVSYVEHAAPQACAIYFEAWDEMYSASDGAGASLNGAPIHVSACVDLREAMVSTAYRGTDPARVRRFTQRVQRLLPYIEGFRLPGAPSLAACCVAAGRYDFYAYIAAHLDPPAARPFPGQPWETAAFVLLVSEAGGAVAPIGGDGSFDILGHNLFAASPELIAQYREVMDEA